ncbi:MAG TPA: D-alanyl-D-alanine carboxypeptidase family protein [Oscillatoriaceae cyanobacterium]
MTLPSGSTAVPATPPTPPAQPTTSTASTSTSTPNTSTTNNSGAWQAGNTALPENRRSFKLVGDPHATAGDGKKFDNEQVGTMTQLKSASGDFELQTTQQHPPGKPGVTVNTAAALKVGKNTVSYDLTRHQLTVNGKAVKVKAGASIDLPGGGTVKVDGKGKTVSITSAKDDVVNLHLDKTKKGVPLLDIDGTLGPTRSDGEVRGALGNFHAGDGNDFIGADGKSYAAQYGNGDYQAKAGGGTYNKANVDAFEKSWMVSGKSLLEQNQGKGTNTQQWESDANKVAKASSNKSQLSLQGGSSGLSANGEDSPLGNVNSNKTVMTSAGPMVTREGKLMSPEIAPKFDKMVAAAKAAGVNLEMEMCYRSYQEQEKLYQAYLNGTGNIAAKPGTSNHEKGLAIDFKGTPGAFDWLKAHASSFGLYNYPPEPWHYSIDGH